MTRIWRAGTPTVLDPSAYARTVTSAGGLRRRHRTGLRWRLLRVLVLPPSVDAAEVGTLCCRDHDLAWTSAGC